MTFTAGGFPGKFTEKQWSKLLGLIGYEGTIGCAVAPVPGEARQVTIGTGIANVGGIIAENLAAVTLTAGTNVSSLTRIDSVILQATWNGASSTLVPAIKPGTPSSTPQPPVLTKTPGVLWELRLANLTIAPGQGAFTSGDITGTRTPPARGIYNTSSTGFPDPSVGALVWHYPTNSLRAPVDGEYVTIAHGRGVDHGCGVFTNLPAVGSGQHNLTHGLGWTPTTMTFTRHDPLANQGVIDVTIRWMNDSGVGITLKQPANGAAFGAAVGALGWMAMRNV